MVLTGSDDRTALLTFLTTLFGFASVVANDGNTRQSIRHVDKGDATK